MAVLAVPTLVLGCGTARNTSVMREYEAVKSAGTEYAANHRTAPDELSADAGLDDLLAYAAARNPQLEAAFYRWRSALEKVPQALGLPDPRLSYTYYIENVETRVGPQRHALALTQTFPWFGKREIRGDIALEEANARWERLETLRRRVFFNVRHAYYEYWYIERSIAVTGDVLTVLGTVETAVRSRYTTGGASYADLVRVQMQIERLRERLASLEDLRNPVIAELNAALDRAPDAEIPPPKALPRYSLSADDDELIDRLAETNPELSELAVRAVREKRAVDMAVRDGYPDITVGMNYIETGAASMPNTAGSGKDAVMGIVSLNIPLWREKYRAGVRESTIRHTAAVREREARETALVAELKRTLYGFRDAQRKIELYGGSLIPKARESLEVSLREYESGGGGFIDVLDGVRTLLEIELALVRAETDRAKQFAGIELLAGTAQDGKNASERDGENDG